MKVHLNQIPADGVHLEGEEPASILDLTGPDFIPATPVRYSLDVGKTSDDLFAAGQLAVDLDARCVRCLEHFVLPIRLDHFACQVELTGQEEIDLTDALKEDILLALPGHPRCDWNGSKKCPGVDRPASADSTDSGESRRDVWGALDQLKNQ